MKKNNPYILDEDYINGYNEAINIEKISENFNYKNLISYKNAKNKKNWERGFLLGIKLKKQPKNK